MPPPGLPRPADARWPRCCSTPPHGLLHQSYAPSDMRGGGTVNADGFGAGWYPAAGSGVRYAPSVPARYRSDRPALVGHRRSPSWPRSPSATGGARRGALGHRRHARHRRPRRRRSPRAVAVQPQRRGPRLAGVGGRRSRRRCRSRDLLTLDAPTDAALLWALVRHRLRAGDDPAAVLADVVLAVAAAAPGSRLNLLLTDGTAVWATAWTHALSVRAAPGAVTVASEPSTRARLGGGAGPAPRGRHAAALRRPAARCRRVRARP